MLNTMQGREFKGPYGKELAASKIQATYQMYRERNQYLDTRHRKSAAAVVAMSWIMSVKMTSVRARLQARRAEELDAFRTRAQVRTPVIAFS